jgi:multicomponent Na+:H+ antiporter subunit E
MHISKWAILLSAFWLLLSGYIEPLLLSFGLISVAIVLIVLKRMDAVDQEPILISSIHKITHYFIWLLIQIAKSSIHVTKLIWGSSDKLSPTLATISASNIHPSKRTLYANSITLTPGTLSVDLKNDEITVHALQNASIEELKEGQMERKITNIWGENK